MIWTRFNKDEHVSDEYAFMEAIAKICDVLACGVDDILEFTLDGGGYRSGSKSKDERNFYGRDLMEVRGQITGIGRAI